MLHDVTWHDMTLRNITLCYITTLLYITLQYITLRKFSEDPPKISPFAPELFLSDNRQLYFENGSEVPILLLTGTVLAIACENIRFSSLFVAEDVSRGGTSATQWQKFHTDDVYNTLQSGVLVLKTSKLASLHFLLAWVLANDDRNISMKKRSLHDDFLKKLICIIHTARCFIKRVKQVKINNKNCPIRM